MVVQTARAGVYAAGWSVVKPGRSQLTKPIFTIAGEQPSAGAKVGVDPKVDLPGCRR